MKIRTFLLIFILRISTRIFQKKKKTTNQKYFYYIFIAQRCIFGTQTFFRKSLTACTMWKKTFRTVKSTYIYLCIILTEILFSHIHTPRRAHRRLKMRFPQFIQRMRSLNKKKKFFMSKYI